MAFPERLGRPHLRFLVAGLLIFVLFVSLPLSKDSEGPLGTYNYIQHLKDSSPNFPTFHFRAQPQQSALSPDDIHRQNLATIRPADLFTHSKTLSVANALYLVSLPRRTDRRETMESIASALDISFIYVDATDFSTLQGKELVEKLMDRVRWQRWTRIDERIAKKKDWPIAHNDTGGGFVENAFPFEWSPDAIHNQDHPLLKPVGISGADHWDIDPLWDLAHPLPVMTEKERNADPVMCSAHENKLNLRAELTKAMVSCWHSHILALRKIIHNRNEVAIIFEDDIDVEWDIERKLVAMWQSLPSKWDIIYLGHCFSSEYSGPHIPSAPNLHESTHALCTHSYALTLSGATRLYRYLRSPDYAYTRPLDHAIRELILLGKLKSYSVYPPITIQTKLDKSDIVGNWDQGWRSREDLVDSTLQRIEMLKSKDLEGQ